PPPPRAPHLPYTTLFRSHQREGPRHEHAHQLVSHLAPVTIEPAHRLSHAKDGIHDLLRENAGQQRANRAARAVHAESIERVIITEGRLDPGDHREATYSGDRSDHERRHG